jgi:hypothetical protein
MVKAILSVIPASVFIVSIRNPQSTQLGVEGPELTLEEEDSLVGNQVTSQVLRSVDAAHNEGTVKVNAAEQLKVAGLLLTRLKVNSTAHHSNSLRGIGDDGATSQTADGLGCLFKTALADKPPGRLGSKVEEDGERGGEHPLQCNGDAVGDWVVNRLVDVADGLDDDGANGPEHLEHLSGRGTKPHGHNLRAVGRGVGNEDTPRHTFEKLSSQEDGQGLSEVEDEDEAVEQHQAGDGGPAVADGGGQRTSEEAADEGTNGTGGLESGLPGVLDDPFLLAVVHGQDTVVLCEAREGNEVTHQEHAVGLHDL